MHAICLHELNNIAYKLHFRNHNYKRTVLNVVSQILTSYFLCFKPFLIE